MESPALLQLFPDNKGQGTRQRIKYMWNKLQLTKCHLVLIFSSRFFIESLEHNLLWNYLT
uniref:Uncharacterized protein n=1 Tax=Nelumbo nucifera TaxID=4432 RepID=A0A822XPB0_NELNU|nr:TPA_asm: hypothetical protein HUJ06_022362 [Nelumbo nucifera]